MSVGSNELQCSLTYYTNLKFLNADKIIEVYKFFNLKNEGSYFYRDDIDDKVRQFFVFNISYAKTQKEAAD